MNPELSLLYDVKMSVFVNGVWWIWTTEQLFSGWTKWISLCKKKMCLCRDTWNNDLMLSVTKTKRWRSLWKLLLLFPLREASVTLRPATRCLARSWWWFWSVWSLCRSEPFTPSRLTPCRSAAPCWRAPRACPLVAMPTTWRSACVPPTTWATRVRWANQQEIQATFYY